jgi:hypothetical protein
MIGLEEYYPTPSRILDNVFHVIESRVDLELLFDIVPSISTQFRTKKEFYAAIKEASKRIDERQTRERIGNDRIMHILDEMVKLQGLEDQVQNRIERVGQGLALKNKETVQAKSDFLPVIYSLLISEIFKVNNIELKLLVENEARPSSERKDLDLPVVEAEAKVLDEIAAVCGKEFEIAPYLDDDGNPPWNILYFDNISTHAICVKNRHVVYLGIDDCTSLPDSIGIFTRLEAFQLTSSKTRFDGRIPISIGNWRELKTIRIVMYSKSTIPSLPASFGDLTSLEIAYLNVQTLPETLGNCHNLQELHLAGNGFHELPISIGQLRSLKVLDLSANDLTYLPDFISELDSLEELHLDNNKLTSLPMEITKQPKLKVISFSGNPNMRLDDKLSRWLKDRQFSY